MKLDSESLRNHNPQLYQNFVDSMQARFLLEPVLALAVAWPGYTLSERMQHKIDRMEERGGTAEYDCFDALHLFVAEIEGNPFFLDSLERLLRVEQEARFAFAPVFEDLREKIAAIHCNYERKIFTAIDCSDLELSYFYRKAELGELMDTYSQYFPELRNHIKTSITV